MMLPAAAAFNRVYYTLFATVTRDKHKRERGVVCSFVLLLLLFHSRRGNKSMSSDAQSQS